MPIKGEKVSWEKRTKRARIRVRVHPLRTKVPDKCHVCSGTGVIVLNLASGPLDAVCGACDGSGQHFRLRKPKGLREAV